MLKYFNKCSAENKVQTFSAMVFSATSPSFNYFQQGVNDFLDYYSEIKQELKKYTQNYIYKDSKEYFYLVNLIEITDYHKKLKNEIMIKNKTNHPLKI